MLENDTYTGRKPSGIRPERKRLDRSFTCTPTCTLFWKRLDLFVIVLHYWSLEYFNWTDSETLKTPFVGIKKPL